jgi:ACS family glucarate transporter-like MFS transporter
MSNRYVIVAVTAVAALWLYIDRVCLSILVDPIQTDLGLTDREKARVLSAFFLTYAFFQIPMGSLADRFGPRLVLGLLIAVWSLVTAATGFVWGFATLLGVRLILGIAEAGAYPAAAVLVKRWARPEDRGRFSSYVAFGGRAGGVIAPYLTAKLAVALAGVGLASWFVQNPSEQNWRGVFVVYGLCGLAVALLFWLIVRDFPPGSALPEKEEPKAPSEDWHAHPPEPPKVPTTFARQLILLSRSRNMWLFGALQFGVNIGWVFVITLLPTYLINAGIDDVRQRGLMQTVVLFIGACGMLFGGFVTDRLRARLGPRLGRSVPLGATISLCALVLFLVPTLPGAWAVVAALGAMAFLVDLHNPTIWSFAQDVGGKNVGAALGFGNMLGNLGAALSPVLLTEVRDAAGWNAVFTCCGCCFIAAAVCGFLLDATRPVDTTDA